MNKVNITLLILGMAAVTYIPRALPAVLIEKMHFSRKVEKFLRLIPYTAMAALIFPGVLSADAARPEAPTCASICACLLKMPFSERKRKSRSSAGKPARPAADLEHRKAHTRTPAINAAAAAR